MKKCNIFMALAATTAFTACSNDNELIQQEMTGSELDVASSCGIKVLFE